MNGFYDSEGQWRGSGPPPDAPKYESWCAHIRRLVGEKFHNWEMHEKILNGESAQSVPENWVFCPKCGIVRPDLRTRMEAVKMTPPELESIATVNEDFVNSSMVSRLLAHILTQDKEIENYKRRLKPSNHDVESRWHWDCVIARNTYLESQLASLKSACGETPRKYYVSVCWKRPDGTSFDSEAIRVTEVKALAGIIQTTREEAVERLRKNEAWGATDFNIMLSTLYVTELR